MGFKTGSKDRIFIIGLLCSALCLTVGCSLAARRPVQEMVNAEAAIQAAKDVNADSLTPEIYRAAVEAHFKAKREYRLKNFENARKHALRAMRLAEQGEFEAYRKGGATPEAMNEASGYEGALPDADTAFKDAGTPSEDELSPSAPAAPPASAGKEPSLEKESVIDPDTYNLQKADEDAAKQPKKAAPSATPAPTSFVLRSDRVLAQVHPEQLKGLGGGDLTPKTKDPYYWVKQSPPPRSNGAGEIPDMNAPQMEPSNLKEAPKLGEEQIPETENFQETDDVLPTNTEVTDGLPPLFAPKK